MDRSHVLIVEDDASVCKLLFAVLDKAGYRVSITHNGDSAMSSLEEDPPDVVVLDLNLPGMNGLDICRAIRRDPWMNKIPVLMLTGQTEEDDIVAGLETGADDYMTKPFSAKVLEAHIKVLLRRANGNKQPALPDAGADRTDETPVILNVKTLGQSELCFADRRLSWTEDFSPAQRQLLSLLVCKTASKASQEEVQLCLWPDSTSTKARSSFDSLLSRVRNTLDKKLAPFDSKKFLVVKHGYLCLENVRVDAHEFIRLVRKAAQQLANREHWPAEITFSSAFSLWQGTFTPGSFGSDSAVNFQDELEQKYLDASLTFARLLATGNRYQPAIRVLRDALRVDPTNDSVARLLYHLYLSQGNPGTASQVLKQYHDALSRGGFDEADIEGILQTMTKEKSAQEWLLDTN